MEELELQMPHVPSSAANVLRRERENTETLELVLEGREFWASGFFGNIWRLAVLRRDAGCGHLLWEIGVEVVNLVQGSRCGTRLAVL